MPPTVYTQENRIYKIGFDPGHYLLPKFEDADTLRKVGSTLSANLGAVALLTGQVPPDGGEQGKKLAAGRADTVKRILMAQGLSPGRFLINIVQLEKPKAVETWITPESMERDNPPVEVFVDVNPTVSLRPDGQDGLNPYNKKWSDFWTPLPDLGKDIRDALRRYAVPKEDPNKPCPVPGAPGGTVTPDYPDWMWNPDKFPKSPSPQKNWKDYSDRVKQWFKDNHIDPKPFLDWAKDRIFPDPPKQGPLDQDHQKDQRDKSNVPGPRPDDD
jgi:hypothetical protein